MEAIGSPTEPVLFGQRRLWVRVDVQAPAIRKGQRDQRATLIAALRGLAGASADGGSPSAVAIWGAHAASASR